MIELKGVSKYYHTGDTISMGLHNVNISMNAGEIIAIVGESGSGKSTLLNVITKLDTFDEGEIYYKGNETSYFSISDMDDFRKNKIGFIFQNSNIIDSYTVLENVMLPLTLKGMGNKEAKKRALELIEKVGLSHRIRSRGTKLSGGEKQRCVIARALASDCEILACDEPTGNLDSKTGEEIIKLIKEVAKDKLVLIVTHNYEQVESIATRKIKVSDGQIIEDEIINNVEEEEHVELDLDYKPLKKSVCARVAKNNVVFTPKKTILLMFIFLAVCIGSLFMFQFIDSSNSYAYERLYKNNISNRYNVYSINHDEIDMDKLKGFDYDANAFYEDNLCLFWFNRNDGELSMQRQGVYSDRYSYRIEYGRKAKTADEVVVICPNSYEYSYIYCKESVNSKIDMFGREFTIVGIASNKLVSRITFTGNEACKKYMQQCSIALNSNLYLNGDCYNRETSSLIQYNKEVTKPTLLFDEDYFNITNLTVTSFGLYDYSKVFDVKKSTSLEHEVLVLAIGDSLPEDAPVYEVSVYGNYNKLRSNLSSKTYGIDKCATATDLPLLEIVAMNISTIFQIIAASISLIIVFFLTYVILARVYVSKKKDYEILRTLGVTKKDMRHIVNFEVCGVGAFISIVSYIGFIIMLETIPNLYSLGSVGVFVSIYYFVTMMIFVYFVARRFNRRLFKFSVTKSLKDGGLHA